MSSPSTSMSYPESPTDGCSKSDLIDVLPTFDDHPMREHSLNRAENPATRSNVTVLRSVCEDKLGRDDGMIVSYFHGGKGRMAAVAVAAFLDCLASWGALSSVARYHPSGMLDRTTKNSTIVPCALQRSPSECLCEGSSFSGLKAQYHVIRH